MHYLAHLLTHPDCLFCNESAVVGPLAHGWSPVDYRIELWSSEDGYWFHIV